MKTSIQQQQEEVQKAINHLWVAIDDEQQTLHAAEESIWLGLLVLGRALVGLYLAKVAAHPLQPYNYDGKRYFPAEIRTSEVGVRFGKMPFSRRVGRRTSNSRVQADLPADRKLGLCTGFSLHVVAAIGQLAAQMAFRTARKLFKSVWGWCPSPRATMRMIDTLGASARAFVDQQPAPGGDGTVLCIQADAKGAPSISTRELKRRKRKHLGKTDPNGRRRRQTKRQEWPRDRRAPGNKSKNKKQAAVGVIYTMRRLLDGSFDGPINKRVYATFGGYDELFPWLKAEAVKRGYGTSRIERTLCYADGEKTIWRRLGEYFPDAEACVDFYHVIEKLWPAATAIHREASSKHHMARAKKWLRQQRQRIRTGNIDPVLTELGAALADVGRTGPGTGHRRKVLSAAIKYLEGNRKRMPYTRMRRHGFDISTGIAEGAVRHAVGIRLDGPGMRWGRARAQSVLDLRCIFINEQWDEFIRHLSPTAQRLAPQPVPAIPYDAPRKAA